MANQGKAAAYMDEAERAAKAVAEKHPELIVCRGPYLLDRAHATVQVDTLTVRLQEDGERLDPDKRCLWTQADLSGLGVVTKCDDGMTFSSQSVPFSGGHSPIQSFREKLRLAPHFAKLKPVSEFYGWLREYINLAELPVFVHCEHVLNDSDQLVVRFDVLRYRDRNNYFCCAIVMDMDGMLGVMTREVSAQGAHATERHHEYHPEMVSGWLAEIFEQDDILEHITA